MTITNPTDTVTILRSDKPMAKEVVTKLRRASCGS